MPVDGISPISHGHFGATLCTQNDDGTFTAHLDSDEAIAAMEYVKSLKWDYDVLTADPPV